MVLSLAGSDSRGVEELRNFNLQIKGSVKTDFATGADCRQKVVRFCHDGSRLVTGGTEGVVRVWKVSLCASMWCVCVCQSVSVSVWVGG